MRLAICLAACLAASSALGAPITYTPDGYNQTPVGPQTPLPVAIGPSLTTPSPSGNSAYATNNRDSTQQLGSAALESNHQIKTTAGNLYWYKVVLNSAVSARSYVFLVASATCPTTTTTLTGMPFDEGWLTGASPTYLFSLPYPTYVPLGICALLSSTEWPTFTPVVQGTFTWGVQ